MLSVRQQKEMAIALRRHGWAVQPPPSPQPYHEDEPPPRRGSVRPRDKEEAASRKDRLAAFNAQAMLRRRQEGDRHRWNRPPQ